MSVGTYALIASNTLGSATNSVTFSSIPATFTDLILIVNGTATTTNNHFIRFNNDTASNYSFTDLYGDGSSAGSSRSTNTTYIFIGNGSTNNYTKIAHIMDYSNTTTNKTVLNRQNAASEAVATEVGLWRSTAAINRIDIVTAAGNMNSGTTLKLYGIQAYNGAV